MFSMSALAMLSLDRIALARLGVLEGTEALLPSRSVLPVDWPELERALPDGGLPRGVVEIAARLFPSAKSGAEAPYGGATSIAIAAIRAVHAGAAHAWCAWIAAENGTRPPVHAPALVQAGVDLARLLVVRPPRLALARTVVKVAASGAFDLVIADAPHRHDLAMLRDTRARSGGATGRDGGRDGASALVVRKLALAAEECGTSTLLLTNALVPRSIPWPVAMRLEVERRPEALSVRITRDRRGSVGSQHVVRLVDRIEDRSRNEKNLLSQTPDKTAESRGPRPWGPRDLASERLTQGLSG
jgi:hypothetical protein